MVNKIKEALDKHASKLVFNEDEHTYTTQRGNEIVSLTPVSSTLEFFKSKLDSIPKEVLYNAQIRGTMIHEIAEVMVDRLLEDKDITITEMTQVAQQNKLYDTEKHYQYIFNLYCYLDGELRDGWKPLQTEQRMFHFQERIAGTADLLLYRETNDKFIIKIVDYKTGDLRVSNYPQVAIYHFMLKEVLRKVKNLDKEVLITTDLVSLKTLERMKGF